MLGSPMFRQCWEAWAGVVSNSDMYVLLWSVIEWDSAAGPHYLSPLAESSGSWYPWGYVGSVSNVWCVNVESRFVGTNCDLQGHFGYSVAVLDGRKR